MEHLNIVMFQNAGQRKDIAEIIVDDKHPLVHKEWIVLSQGHQAALLLFGEKVLTPVEQDDAFIEQVKTDTGVRYEGLAVRYGVLILLLIVVLVTIGAAIRGFIYAGTSMMQVALGKTQSKPKQ